MSGKDCKWHKYFSPLKHLQVEVEQLRETDKVFTLGKWVSQYLKSVVGIGGAAVCGNGVGRGYTEGLYGARTGLWRLVGADGGWCVGAV